MSYSETLAKIVENSGLTLKEISEKCKELGINVAPSYISKLQTNKQAPASDEVNIAIAKVCGGDIEKLLYEAYIEKAPEYIKELLKKVVGYLRETAISITKNHNPKTSESIIRGLIYNLSDYDFIKEYSEMFDNFSEYTSPYLMLSPNNKDERFFTNPLLGIEMPDDSMEPTIPRGSTIHFTDYEKLRNGDIVVVVLADKSFLVRRYYLFQDHLNPEYNQVILTADKPACEPFPIDSMEEIKILGKVTSISTKLQ
jgi:transcriptional regulator with XRE-family HTH domain